MKSASMWAPAAHLGSLVYLVPLIVSWGCTSDPTTSRASPDAGSDPDGGELGTFDSAVPAAPDAAGVPPEVQSASGWELLSDAERRALSALLSGQTNPWSLAARSLVDIELSGGGWADESADAQAAFLRSLWDAPEVRPHQASFLELMADRPAVAFTLSGATDLGEEEFAGGTALTSRWELSFEGMPSIFLYAPTSGTSDEGLIMTPHEMADAIAREPFAQRALVRNVILNPFRNPDDAYYDEVFGVHGFRTYMQGRETGRVQVFPQQRPRPDRNDVLLHEMGHIWSLRDLGDSDWEEWEDARTADVYFVSTYASTAGTEDIAECSAVYAALAETPALDEVRAIFPARFAFLDRWMPR